MYPALKGLTKGTYFERLPELKIKKTPDLLYKEKEKWIKEWKTEVMRK